MIAAEYLNTDKYEAHSFIKLISITQTQKPRDSSLGFCDLICLVEILLHKLSCI